MSKQDLHDNLKATIVLRSVALTTTLGAAPKIIDRSGYEGIEFLIDYGSVTATNATITPVMKEGDVTGTLTSVADANMLGLEANAAIAAAATRTSGVSKNVVKRLGYIGLKRYVTCLLVPTVSSAVPCGVIALLGGPHNAPVAT